MAAVPRTDQIRREAALQELSTLFARELESGALELPSYPEVALRVSKALADDDIGIDAVVRVVSAEPSLAVRLLQLANSAALNPAGNHIITLRVAISRIGFNLARSATIAFALSQMRRGEAWRGLETQFGALWEASARLAAMSHAVATRCGGDADQALLAGMLHAVGKLFVLTRVAQHPVVLADPVAYAGLEGEWHARLARALLRRWHIAEPIIAAACDFESAASADAAVASLSDVLFAAAQLSKISVPDELVAAGLIVKAPFQRLGLDEARCRDALLASDKAVASLRAALAA